MSERDNAIRDAIAFANGVAVNFTIGLLGTTYTTEERQEAMAKGWENWPKLRRRMDALQAMTPRSAQEGFERDAMLMEVLG